ncbi:MAG: polyprenol monophosphomannose synthase [Planctomycetaceae bacterium]|nr:polyprenol monophosphomannose synthase [Planctomycetaceae bacterium]
MKILITLCTYNEKENLQELIPVLRAIVPEADILVIDDNSPDGTGDFVRETANQDRHVLLLQRPGKLGLGTATLAGFMYGIEHQYDYLVNLDADFSHNPRYIPELIASMTGGDVAIASRYMPGGGVVGWTRGRKLMSQMINVWAKLWLRLDSMDNSGSFRCYRVALLSRIDWAKTIATGYAFQEEVLYRCRKAGGRMTEVPFMFEDRRHGVTKINLRECYSAVWVIFRLGLQNLFGASVLK